MATYAILDAATRVLKRSTTVDPPPVTDDEVAVSIKADEDLSGGLWKFDDEGNKSEATAEERLTAFTPKPTAEVQALIDGWNAVAADGGAPASLRAVAALEAARYAPRPRLE